MGAIKKKRPTKKMPDMRKEKAWFNKGFYIYYGKERKHFRAYTTNPERYAGSSKNYRHAVTIAISTAHERGVLNWKATVAWAKKEKIKISYDDVFARTKTTTKKGFYVRLSGNSGNGGKRYEGLVGESARSAKTVASGREMREVVIAVLPIAKAKPYYDEFSAVEWLKNKGMPDLVGLARIAA